MFDVLLPAPVRPGSSGSVMPIGTMAVAKLMSVPDCGAVPLDRKRHASGGHGRSWCTLFIETLTAPQAAPPAAIPHDALTPVMAEGTLSANTVAFAESGPAFDTVTVYVIAVPQAMLARPDLVTETLATGFTVKVALAGIALLPALVVSAPAKGVHVASVLTAVTLIETVHEPDAGTVPPVSVTDPAECVTIATGTCGRSVGCRCTHQSGTGVTGKVSVTLPTVIGFLGW